MRVRKQLMIALVLTATAFIPSGVKAENPVSEKKPLTLSQFLKKTESLQKQEIKLKKQEILLLNMKEDLFSKMEALKRAEQKIIKQKNRLTKLKEETLYALMNLIKKSVKTTEKD